MVDFLENHHLLKKKKNKADKDNQLIHNENNENNRVRTLRDYMNPTRTSARSCIVFPPDASHFNFKLGII
jgi:hypothetical protein